VPPENPASFADAPGPARSCQEMLKNALDRTNNNLSFTEAAPCAFSFAAI
jgi:hypothetical protein